MKSILLFVVLLLNSCISVQAEIIQKYTASFTSTAGGGYTESIPIAGRILRVVTNPGATAPTDNWDVTLIDADGLDLFMGRGADRDTANTEQFCPGIPMTDGTNITTVPVVHYGTCTLTVTNAGASKAAVVTIYFVADSFLQNQD